MIGKLKGKVDLIGDEYLILDVNGVGYRIFCTSRTLDNCKIGDEMSFIINTIVREDAILLFGFTNNIEKEWFDNLCKINGIGSKMGLKIIGSMTTNDIITAIDSDDPKSFCKVPGVGQKIASRIIIELKNVRKNLSDTDSLTASLPAEIKDDNKVKDALSALENLGYQRNISYNVIMTILKERDDLVLESLITESLKRLNKF